VKKSIAYLCCYRSCVKGGGGGDGKLRASAIVAITTVTSLFALLARSLFVCQCQWQLLLSFHLLLAPGQTPVPFSGTQWYYRMSRETVHRFYISAAYHIDKP